MSKIISTIKQENKECCIYLKDDNYVKIYEMNYVISKDNEITGLGLIYNKKYEAQFRLKINKQLRKIAKKLNKEIKK